SVLAFAGMCGTLLMAEGVAIVTSTVLGILSGVAWGAINGLVVTRLKVPPFIATLGSMGMARGLTLLMTNGIPVTAIPQRFGHLGDGNLFAIVPIPVVLLLGTGLVMSYVLRYTRLGRYAYAMGGNPQASYLSGINLTACTLIIYSILGGLTGLAGMIEASRLVTVQPTAGEGYELRVIAAVVIGGRSLSCGAGTVLGTRIGAFIMNLLNNGWTHLGISPFVQQILIGCIIVLAVASDELRRRKLG